jgi:hypothetical protein
VAIGGAILLVYLPIFATPSFARAEPSFRASIDLPPVQTLVYQRSQYTAPRLELPQRGALSVETPAPTLERVESDLAFEAAMLGVGLFVMAPIAGDFAGRRSQAVIDDVTIFARTLTVTGAALAISHELFDRINPDGSSGLPRYMTSTFAALTAIAMGIGYQLGLDWLAFGADAVLGGVVAASALVAGEYYGDEILTECTDELAIGTLEKCLKRRPTPPVHVRFRSSAGGGLLSVRMSL